MGVFFDIEFHDIYATIDTAWCLHPLTRFPWKHNIINTVFWSIEPHYIRQKLNANVVTDQQNATGSNRCNYADWMYCIMKYMQIYHRRSCMMLMGMCGRNDGRS